LDAYLDRKVGATGEVRTPSLIAEGCKPKVLLCAIHHKIEWLYYFYAYVLLLALSRLTLYYDGAIDGIPLPVPEPSTAGMLLLGLACLAGATRLRKTGA